MEGYRLFSSFACFDELVDEEEEEEGEGENEKQA